MLRRQHIVPLLLVSAGCAARVPATWRLTGTVLTPPGVAEAAAERTFMVPRGAARGECPRVEAVGVDGRKGRLKVTVNRAALEKQPKGWLSDWSARAEEERCVTPGEGAALATRILEAVPLVSGVRVRLLSLDDVRAGYVDLGPKNRLEVISPIVRRGASEDAPLIEEAGVEGAGNSLTVTLRASKELIGHETAWYALEPKQGGGTRIVVISAETSIQHVVEPKDAPAKNYFTFGPETGFYRLFYKADQTEVLVGAVSREKLPLDLDTCDKPGGPTCITIPRRVGINPYLTLTVNGKPLAVPTHLPATVQGAIQAAKQRPGTVLPTLVITKPYAGKQTAVVFDRAKKDILSMVLTGNEEIRW
jgi:hypothetical protein